MAQEPFPFNLTLRDDGVACAVAEGIEWPADPEQGEEEVCEHTVAVIVGENALDHEHWMLIGYYRLFFDGSGDGICTGSSHDDGKHSWEGWEPDWTISADRLSDALHLAALWMEGRIGAPVTNQEVAS